jgi:branched-chain amino acid transport system substrate-binding protein
VGASLSLTGDFAAQGQQFQNGYRLWAAQVNKHGGLLGHPIKLVILSDASSPTAVVTNYETLINTDHAKLLLGPYSTLLTVPAAAVARRYGYAFIEGAGGGPSVFALNLHDLFDVSLPIADNLTAFAHWVASLPSATRPKTAAYVTSNDPFTEPQIPTARGILQSAGLRTVLYTVFPSEVTSFASIADSVVQSHAQVVVLGATSLTTVAAFIQEFKLQNYNPEIFLSTQSLAHQSLVSAVGQSALDGTMYPADWYYGYKNAESEAFVNAYVKAYGGSPSLISTSAAGAYAVGQVLADAVKATGGFSNSKIIAYLHSGVTLQTILGGVRFTSNGENPAAADFAFQWQGAVVRQVAPATAPGSVRALFPKPDF